MLKNLKDLGTAMKKETAAKMRSALEPAENLLDLLTPVPSAACPTSCPVPALATHACGPCY
jgi:hypothetical protein